MKTLSATPRPWYHWKAEDFSLLHMSLVWGVTLPGLLIKKRQSWAFVLRYYFRIQNNAGGNETTFTFAVTHHQNSSQGW